jgi:hypothetical protein
MDVIYFTQASRNSCNVLENVYDVSKSRYGIEEAFLPCKAPLLFRAAQYCSTRPMAVVVVSGHAEKKPSQHV